MERQVNLMAGAASSLSKNRLAAARLAIKIAIRAVVNEKKAALELEAQKKKEVSGGQAQPPGWRKVEVNNVIFTQYYFKQVAGMEVKIC